MLAIVLVITGCGQKEESVNSGNTGTDSTVAVDQLVKNQELAQVAQNALAQECDPLYEELRKKHDKSERYNDCRGNIYESDCEKQKREDAGKQRNLILIIDSSGSMAAQIGSKSKMEIAKEVLNKLADDINEEVNTSLIVYGHKGGNAASQKQASCAGIEEVYPLGKINSSSIKQVVNGLRPVGWTPIAASLEKAGQILVNHPSDSNKNTVILISDGEETCGGAPAAKARELNQQNIGLVSHVIGFDVGGAAENQLKNIAQNGQGEYHSAKTAEELKKAIGEITVKDCMNSNAGDWRVNDLINFTTYNQCLVALLTERDNIMIEISNRFTKEPEVKKCMDYMLDKNKNRIEGIKQELDRINQEQQEKIDQQLVE